MIVLYAGRRSGSAEFPDENVAFAGEQVAQMLAGLRPRLVIGSAAAGADVLVLEAVERLEIEARAVILGDPAVFAELSVADKGVEWERRYEHQLARARVTVERVAEASTPDEGFRAVTRRIAELGEALAEPGEPVVVLAVSRPRQGAMDHTEELALHGAGPNRLVLRVDPGRARGELPSAFVAMPFGVKPYPDRGWRRYDANLTYHRVMVPALIDAGYRPIRADTDALLEVIDHSMLREINRAEVMLVDLAMLNANVMWELGLRHAWRRSGTVLIAPEWIKHPFDIQRVPTFPYRRTASQISDGDAVAAIAMLKDVLAAVGEGRTDSPVFANVNALAEVELPELPGERDSAGDLLERCTLARDLGDVAGLLETAAAVEGASGLADTARTALLEQIGLSLLDLQQFAPARRILEPLALADERYERVKLQQQFAHLLIRADEGSDVEDAEQRLGALRVRHGDDPETLGLLGSAAKVRVEGAAAAGDRPPPAALARAIECYRKGLAADPGDFYPGVNAVALLRLSGQRWGGPKAHAEQARALLPIVRFAAESGPAAGDVWARLTIAECALHELLLGGDADPNALYAAAVWDVHPKQRRSAARQLRLMRDAGDPPEVLDPILALFGSDP